MSNFLKTKFTIEPGHGMGSFSSGHLLWLALLICLIVFLGRAYREGTNEKRKSMRIAVALLIIADELLKDIAMPFTGQWEWEFLPLHICSISVFIVAIHAFTGNRLAGEYLYAVTLPTASLAMLFPDWTGSLPLFNLMCFHSFSIHLLLVLYPSLMLSGGFCPSLRYLKKFVPVFAMMFVIMHFINNALDTNFFFVNGSPEGSPLEFIEDRIGKGYLLAFPLIAVMLWLPMYTIPCRRKAVAHA